MITGEQGARKPASPVREETDGKGPSQGHLAGGRLHAAGGPGKPTRSNPGRAPRSDPTLLDWHEYPARDLAALYKWRWDGSETALRETKSALRGAGPGTGPMLRSQTPGMIRQELAAWAAATEMTRGTGRDAALAAIPARKRRRAGQPVQPRETAARRPPRRHRRRPPRQAAQLHRLDQRTRQVPHRHRPEPAPRPQGKILQRLPARRGRQVDLGRQRDHTLLLIAIQTGLRAAELIGLRCQDAELGAGPHVRVHGKGRKERVVPLTAQSARALTTWLKERRSSPADPVFPSRRGGMLSHDALGRLVAKDAPSHPAVLAARPDGGPKGLPMFTRCPLTEGGTRLSACGTHQRLLRSHSPPTPPGSGNSHPGQAIRSLAQQAAHRARPISAGFEAIIRQDR